MLRKKILVGFFIIGSSVSSVLANVQPTDQGLTQLADKLYEHSLDATPEYAMFAGQPDTRPDQLSDNSLDALARSQKIEDEMLKGLASIDPTKFTAISDSVTYSVVKEMLENARDVRICKRELWSIDHMFGWQVIYPQLLSMQPLATETDRDNFVDRWQKLPKFLANKQANLTHGLALGYSTPKSVVRRVIKQLSSIIELKTEESPLYSPATRTQAEDFKERWHKLVNEEIKPAIEHYLGFLETSYLDEARIQIGLIEHPNGRQCYMAYYSEWTGLELAPEEVYKQGTQLVAANTAKVINLGKALWQTKSFSETIAKSKQVAGQNFTDAEQMIAYSESTELRAKAKLTEYFAILPKAELKIEPYPDHYKGSGVPNKYQPPTSATPYGLYKINTFSPEEGSRAGLEITAFHEGYPGHHLQMAIATELPSPHKVMEMYGNSAFIEGWGRYAEQLADEMGLYIEPASNVVRHSWPGRGMVVDPGLHLFGWTREQAVNYINESGRFPPAFGDELVDRIAVIPAQLTAYDSGALEFFRLRQFASERMGEDFDIKQFHATLLGNGNVPLSMLDSMIQQFVNNNASN